MILQEFIFLDNKDQVKSLGRLNKIKRGYKDNNDDGIAPDCKCDWKGNCEDLCRHNMK